jgi:hypothetical protein
MGTELERRKVLQCVKNARNVEELVDWKIPYSRILTLLRLLVKEELLRYEGAQLLLTEAGEAMLAEEASPEPRALPSPDRLESARILPQDPDAVHLPRDEVD